MNDSHVTIFPVPTNAKWAFTTRRVNRTDATGISTRFEQARSGDLVLAKVFEIGHHKRVQLAEGRPSESYLDDLVVLTCGDRYAPDQFEGIAELNPAGADLLAGGGVLGRMRRSNNRTKSPTKLKPLGLLTNVEGEIINIDRYALVARKLQRRVPVIGVIGASMNAGKTTAVASLAHGLRRSGLFVAAIKATGTGAFGDFNAYLDAGAAMVADFTDAGMASTYRQPLERIEDAFESLVAHAVDRGVDVVVVELADGIFQKETAALLNRSRIRDSLSSVLFAAPDALSALGGVTLLREIGLEPFAVTGMVSCSPLAAAEAEAAANVPVVSRDVLRDAYLLTRRVGNFMEIGANTAADAPVGPEANAPKLLLEAA